MMTQKRKLKAQIRELAQLNGLSYTEAKRQFEQIMQADDPYVYIPLIEHEEHDSYQKSDAILLGYTAPEIQSNLQHINIVPKNDEQSLVFWDMHNASSSVLYIQAGIGNGGTAQLINIMNHSAHHAAIRYTIDVGDKSLDSLTEAGHPSSAFILLQKVYHHIIDNRESQVPIYLHIFHYTDMENSMQESQLLKKTYTEMLETILTQGKDHGVYAFIHLEKQMQDYRILGNIHHTYNLLDFTDEEMRLRGPGHVLFDGIEYRVFPTNM